MSAPRLEVHLDRIAHNTRSLVGSLGPRGIAVCGVTKATLGSPEVARAVLDAGATSLGESRLGGVERLRRAGITAPIMLVRSPMPSQADRVVAGADVSLNSEFDVIALLSASAARQGRRHGVVLMVELGDLREGLLAGDLLDTARAVLRLPGIDLIGIGTNLACQNGVIPGAAAMAELSGLATAVESALDIHLAIVSGGNSANLPWALDPTVDTGRINHLRLGESVLLGREPLHRTVLDGLRPDAIALVGEVIESKVKPARPWGHRGQSAFGVVVSRPTATGERNTVIVALGLQDVDTAGLVPPAGYELLGASSDHLVLDGGTHLPAVGCELRFGVDYSAMMRAMASPFVAREYLD